MTEHTAYRPYTWSGAFAYSLRCALCRAECEHTLEQHNILTGKL